MAKYYLMLSILMKVMSTNLQQDTNGMAATNCVSVLLQIISKGRRVQSFNDVHTLRRKELDKIVSLSASAITKRQGTYFAVKSFNWLVDRTPWTFMESVPKPLAPVAKVRGNNNQVLRVCQILGKNPAIQGFFLRRKRSNKNRNNSELVLIAVKIRTIMWLWAK